MRIKRLDICGFKSFMERSVFSFDDGITGVVGPNGCGKSNVVDAIRWVMGEQSAKNLRGRGMEDVIFNGSESKAPLSMAEVSLTFRVEEHDELAPQYAGYPEITVTRRLFRSGESEYLINKTTCRLLDITELFLGTGVGTKAYSIIEQGRVGLIVSSKPEDRRALIEEAAGITKYKARRKAAERKMEYTQQNLTRVNDIVSELSRRLDALERQAKKAEKYKRLKSDVREIELHVASHRYLGLIAEKKALQYRLDNLSGEERESLERVRSLEEAIGQKRHALEEEGRALVAFQDQVYALESQVRLDEQNLAHWTQDQEDSLRRVEQAQAELESLSNRKRELDSTTSTREQELLGLTGSSKDDETNMSAAQEELRRLTGLQAELSSRLDQERAALIAVASRLANHENNLVNLARQRTDLEARRAKNRAEADVLRQEEEQLEKSRNEVAERVSQSRQAALEIAERRTHEEEALGRTRQVFTENEIQVIGLREELGDKRSRLATLQEIQHNYEGFDRGVRAVMLKVGQEARTQGIFGLVADVLSTTPRYEKAIEAALGERLQHVVVESRDKGLEFVHYLKALSEGRSTFVPVVSDAPVPEAAAPDTSRPGILTSALAEIRCEDALLPLVQALLGDVVIVSDLATAQEYSAGEGRRFTLVTLDGEVIRPDGSVTGGEREGAAVGALQKKREIAELTEEVARVEERYNEILTRHYTLQKQMGHAEGVLKGLEKNRHAEELNLAAQEKDLHKAGADLARIRDRLSVLDSEDAQLSQALSVLQVEEEASRGEVAHGQTDREGREEKVRQLTVELESVRQKFEQLSSDLTSLRVKVAANSERDAAARKELEQIASTRRELEERLLRLVTTIKEGGERVDELARRIEQATEAKGQSAQKLLQMVTELDQRRRVHAEQSVQVKDEDAQLRDLRTRVDELTHGLSQASLRERELAMELIHLNDQIRERHQLELELELHRYHLLALPPEAEPRVKELRSQLEKMGEINLTAIEEHAELAKRYDFLAGQKKDLEGSLEQLHEAIAKIDKTSSERFAQTFEIVNEKFQQIFPRLFGGGRAGLVLTKEGPGAEPGVEIVAQPPGKKLQSVNLFSGGEKALTAVSLIFAIFLIKPTPFCLLDEVDAPLDEGNVGRYNEMVKEMSKQSQFILITHNKRTMEIADTLYGVTMEEPGISKLVSVNMKAAEAHNDDGKTGGEGQAQGA